MLGVQHKHPKELGERPQSGYTDQVREIYFTYTLSDWPMSVDTVLSLGMKQIAKRAVIATGLLLTPFLAMGEEPVGKNPAEPRPGDSRIDQLRSFLRTKGSPLAEHAKSFLEAADKYSLDWRLLPSLALVETGGMRAIRNNNVFGWGNGRIRFTSIHESIHVIAERLANGGSYKNKNTEDKLRAYNPVNRKYATHVLKMMTLLGPDLPVVIAETAIPAH
jgi:hypothetical protein